MSKYTTELRFMLETFNGQTENGPASKVNEVIENTRSSLFDFSYPAANLTTSEKEHLEKHIMLHYYTREIGFETFGLFKMKLQSRLWDIMPKYDEYYRLNHLDLDFFNDVDYTRKLDSQTDEDGSDTKTGNVVHGNSGYEDTETSGKIVTQNSGGITNVKTGSESEQNSGYTESLQTGKIVDEGGNTLVHTQEGNTYDNETGQVNKVTTGIYSDIESGKIKKAITGEYSDSNTGNVINLHSDTPQSHVDFDPDTTAEEYVSDLQKQIDNKATTRSYDDYIEDTQYGPFDEGLQDPTPGHTVTRKYDETSPLMESTQPLNHKFEHGASNDYEVTDETTTGNERTFDNLKNKITDTTGSTTTYNSVTDTQTDTKKTEQTFDNYKVRNTNTKALTDTYNNLMNTIDKTNVVDLTERIFGNVHGNNIEKLIKYRDSILNLELMIINDLEPLFMQLW